MNKPNPAHVSQYRDEKSRGDAAKQVLESAAFKEANDALRAKLIDTWLRTAPDDVKGREWLHAQALAQAAFQNTLTKLIQTGELARVSLGTDEPAPRTRRSP